MKRSNISPGRKALERGSTFTTRAGTNGKRRPVSPASVAQRAKVAGARSIVSGDSPCDASHLWPRGLGGCNDALCVIPLTRVEHRLFDAGQLDILPYLVAHGLTDELGHALAHARGDLIALLHRTTGERYVPERSVA